MKFSYLERVPPHRGPISPGILVNQFLTKGYRVWNPDPVNDGTLEAHSAGHRNQATFSFPPWKTNFKNVRVV